MPGPLIPADLTRRLQRLQLSINHDDEMEFKRNCFVTVGATAGFRQLLEAVLSDVFLKKLASNGFASLKVQCGPDAKWFADQVSALPERHGLEITSFERTDDMKPYFLECRGQKGVQLAGCVISHAGSGTILEAGRYAVPLIVVPNPTLMNNHQAELAEEVEKQGWAIHGKLGDLAAAVTQCMEHIEQGRHDHLPPYQEDQAAYLGENRIKVFDWVALTAFPDALKRAKHLAELKAMDTPRQTDDAADDAAADKEVDTHLRMD